MITVYVRQGHRALRRWLAEAGTQRALTMVGYMLTGLCLSAASLDQQTLPLVMGFVWACRGWQAVMAAAGGTAGYWLFWGPAGSQGFFWTGLALLGALTLAERRIARELPLLLPSLGMLIVSATGLGFQVLAGDETSVAMYLLRVALGGAACWVFSAARGGHDPICRWLSRGMIILGLAQIAPVPWLGLGYVAAGAMAVTGAFPGAAVAGLAVDLAAVTAVPVTAVTTLAWLSRFLPRWGKGLRSMVPGMVGLTVMYVCGKWDIRVLPGLFLGGILGMFLPGSEQAVYRRGDTGVTQVRLEMAAGVLTQLQQLLLDVRERPVDQDALVEKAAERACGSCSHRKTCRDARRIAKLPGVILHKPLLSAEELPVVCRKSGRFLAELHRSQEQLRSIQGNRQLQREYRGALVQQYGFLSRYLRDLSDRLADRTSAVEAVYTPQIRVFSNREREDNGDRCEQFAGVGNLYYIIVCDGMGTGLGAVQAGSAAAELLKKMLRAGFPAESALQSLNSLCALGDRAGVTTVDLVQLELDTGKASLYKWGAAPSYLVSGGGVQKLGNSGAPPGLWAEESREVTCTVFLRQSQLLLLASDGLAEKQILQCCRQWENGPPEELGRMLLTEALLDDQDDATVVTVRLVRTKTET